MCCLFGMIDYGRNLSQKQKNHVLSILSTQCEVRGTDATGIAYNSGGRLCIYKRPLPAHKNALCTASRCKGDYGTHQNDHTRKRKAK